MIKTRDSKVTETFARDNLGSSREARTGASVNNAECRSITRANKLWIGSDSLPVLIEF